MKKQFIILLIFVLGLTLISFIKGVDAQTDSGLVAYWDFNEGSGNIAYDKVDSNNGTVYGATRVDDALSFNGAGNYIKIPDNPSLNPTSAITISMWVKPSQLRGIALNKENQYRLIAEDVNATKLSARVRINNEQSMGIIGNSSLIVGNWQYVTLTYDGMKWKVYYNGQFDTEVEGVGTISPPWGDDSNLYIGDIGPNRGTGAYFYKGLIDDVKIYSRALSVNELLAEYERGRAPSCTSWTYSDWLSCSSSGNQTRNIISSLPNSCSGGNPVLSQSCTYIPPVCTSWIYSSWSSCSPSGEQTRDIISSSPNSCEGGNPNLSQSCTYVPPIQSCTSSDWSCANWDTCSANGTQTRTCNKNSNCQGGVSSPSTSQSCTPPCTSDTWSCSDWNSCSTYGTQTRNCIKTFDCPSVFTPSPIASQNCTPPRPSCTADIWTCGDWNTCSLSGVQNRSCRKTFDCPDAQTPSPTTDQYCEAPNRPTQQAPQDSPQTSNQDTILKATVKLICPLDENRASQGSGTVIDSSGTILTNKHVVNGTLGCLAGFISDFNDEPYFGDRQIADISKMSPSEDVAVLKLRNPQNKTLPYIDITKGNSNTRLGTKINIYGYPAKFGTNITYTSGDFSGTSGSYLKTTAIIEHGNSGGGAYLNDGTFIGVPSAVIKGELNALGYILSINTINGWLGNSSIAYNNNSNNEFSRVSYILEKIDLKKLGSLQLVILNEKGTSNNNASMASPKVIKTAKPITTTIKQNTKKETPKIQATTTAVSSSQEIKHDKDSVVPKKNIQPPKTFLLKRFFRLVGDLFLRK